MNIPTQNSFIDILKSLFPNIKRARRKVGEVFNTVYRGITLKPLASQSEEKIEFEDIIEMKPCNFILKSTSNDKLEFQEDSTYSSNGNCVVKSVSFNRNGTFEISMGGKLLPLDHISVDSTYQLSASSVSCVFSIVDKLVLCNGMPVNKSISVSRLHTIENWTFNGKTVKSLRHLSCLRIVPYNSKSGTCRVCQKMTFYYNKCDKGKENQPEHDHLPKKRNISESLRELFPNAPDEMVAMLIEQAKNVNRHPKGRRWSKDFICICLQLFNRSPKCYELLCESKILVLPSKSVLIMYKNALKQEPGFDMSLFQWMYDEANRREMTENEKIGGIIFDEMSIQQDIQLEKNGDVLEISGFSELDDEGDMCNQLRKGSRNKVIGTHILQLVFLGINGFRFPFAHFVTDSIQASELFVIFWKAVRILSTFEFRVLFNSMDGAQCNRSFMHVCLGPKPSTFVTCNPCTSNSEPVILMMDISHTLKKIRNNIMKSGILKHSTRLLTLQSKHQIHWQMFVDFYNWDQQNGLKLHRKLTDEHIYPDKQLKMRNYLAEDVLNSEMLHAIQMYQVSLGEKGIVLTGLIEILQQTSNLVTIFRDMRPITCINDSRLNTLRAVNSWFSAWEKSIEDDSSLCTKQKSQCLMSRQCHEDIHSSILGFVALCEYVLKISKTVFVTPGLVNSDIIENVFNQQRSTYNGANTNPNAYQYKKTINSIIVGENVVSKKANAAKTCTSLPFAMPKRDSVMKRQLSPVKSREQDESCNSEKVGKSEHQPLSVLQMPQEEHPH